VYAKRPRKQFLMANEMVVWLRNGEFPNSLVRCMWAMVQWFGDVNDAGSEIVIN